MRETQIRAVLIARLRAEHRHDPSALIRQELGIAAARCRIDVAVVTDQLAGYEIKSDDDKLTRLPRQVGHYSKVLDKAALVTTERHLPAALEVIPAWWGVLVVTPGGTAPQLTPHRPSSSNPAVDPFALAQLLWRDEAMAKLRSEGLHHGLTNARRWFLWRQLAGCLRLTELQAHVLQTLKTRQDWPGGQ